MLRAMRHLLRCHALAVRLLAYIYLGSRKGYPRRAAAGLRYAELMGRRLARQYAAGGQR